MPAIGERLNIGEFKMSRRAKIVKYRLGKKTPFFVHSSVVTAQLRTEAGDSQFIRKEFMSRIVCLQLSKYGKSRLLICCHLVLVILKLPVVKLGDLYVLAHTRPLPFPYQ